MTRPLIISFVLSLVLATIAAEAAAQTKGSLQATRAAEPSRSPTIERCRAEAGAGVGGRRWLAIGAGADVATILLEGRQ